MSMYGECDDLDSFAALPSRSPLPSRLMPVRLGPAHLVIPNSSFLEQEKVRWNRCPYLLKTDRVRRRALSDCFYFRRSRLCDASSAIATVQTLRIGLRINNEFQHLFRERPIYIQLTELVCAVHECDPT